MLDTAIAQTQLTVIEYQYCLSGDTTIAILIGRQLHDWGIEPGILFIPDVKGEQRFKSMAMSLEALIPSLKDGTRAMSELLIGAPDEGSDRKARLTAISTLIRRTATEQPGVGILVLGDSVAVMEAMSPLQYRAQDVGNQRLETFRLNMDNEVGVASSPQFLGNVIRTPPVRRR